MQNLASDMYHGITWHTSNLLMEPIMDTVMFCSELIMYFDKNDLFSTFLKLLWDLRGEAWWNLFASDQTYMMSDSERPLGSWWRSPPGRNVESRREGNKWGGRSWEDATGSKKGLFDDIWESAEEIMGPWDESCKVKGFLRWVWDPLLLTSCIVFKGKS